MAEPLVVPLRAQVKRKPATARAFPLSSRQAYQVVSSLARAIGLDGFRPHDLRHAFGTRLMERGAHPRAVQALLGHRDLATTMIYMDLTAGHLRGAIALLDTPEEKKAAVAEAWASTRDLDPSFPPL